MARQKAKGLNCLHPTNPAVLWHRPLDNPHGESDLQIISLIKGRFPAKKKRAGAKILNNLSCIPIKEC